MATIIIPTPLRKKIHQSTNKTTVEEKPSKKLSQI